MARALHAVRLVSLTTLVLVLAGGPFALERKTFRIGANVALAEAGERIDSGPAKASVIYDTAGNGAATRARSLDAIAAPADPAGMEAGRGTRMRANLAARDSRRKGGAKRTAAVSTSPRLDAGSPRTMPPSNEAVEAEPAALPAILARSATAAEPPNTAAVKEATGAVTVALSSVTSQIRDLWRYFTTSPYARWLVGICLIGVPLASLVWPEMIRRRRDERDLLLFD